MKLNDPSKFAVFVYRFLAFELAGQLILSLLPTGWRDWFTTEFVLRAFLLLGLVGVMLWYLLQISREFKPRVFRSLIPFWIFAVRIVCIPLVLQLSANVKFVIAQKMYNEVVDLAEHDSLKKGKFESILILPSKYWYIGGGQEYGIQKMKSDDQDLLFFNEFGFLDRKCGYLYSSNDAYPPMVWKMDASSSLDFQRISKNWFYGCIKYQG
jgi:hypothetical protein